MCRSVILEQYQIAARQFYVISFGNQKISGNFLWNGTQAVPYVCLIGLPFKQQLIVWLWGRFFVKSVEIKGGLWYTDIRKTTEVRQCDQEGWAEGSGGSGGDL